MPRLSCPPSDDPPLSPISSDIGAHFDSVVDKELSTGVRGIFNQGCAYGVPASSSASLRLLLFDRYGHRQYV